MTSDFELKGLSTEMLNKAHKMNWFRLFVKKRFGGSEANLTEAMKALFEAAAIDGSLGWCVNLGSGASYFSGFLSSATVSELLNDSKSAFAGSGQIGRAICKGDHYLVSGSWPRCTGAAHATSFTANAELEDGSVHTFILPSDQVTITNTWTLMGLDNSSTYQIDAVEIEVPEAHSFTIGKLNTETSYAIHTIPFEPFARCCMIASLLGMTTCFVDKVKNTKGLMSRPNMDEHVLELSGIISDSFDQFRKKATQLEQICSDRIDPEAISNEIKSEVIRLAAGIREKINMIYYHGGLQLADTKNPANSAFRDLLVAGQHNLFR